MATRRMPSGFGMPGRSQPGQGSPMQPRPPMTGAPTGNANPQAQNGSMMQPPVAPLPIQPTAGGPTAPFNVRSMLQPNVSPSMGQGVSQGQGSLAVQRDPLPRWGDAQGTPAPAPSNFGNETGDRIGNRADKSEDMASMMGAQGGAPSLVLLRLLKAMGRL